MAELWSDYADNIITDVDTSMGAKYGKMNVRKFLNNPGKFAAQPNVLADAKSMQDDVDAFIKTLLGEMSDQAEALNDSLEKADSITGQLSQNISMQAKQNRIPIIKPVLIQRNNSNDQVIYLDTADSSVITLIEKIIPGTTYIADSSANYDGHKIGDWTFGGAQNYILRVYVPQTDIILLNNSKTEIGKLFDAAVSFIKERK